MVKALIFDMDGTLWDAVDSYVKVWLRTFEQCGISAHVDREVLLGQMGRHLDDIADTLVPNAPDRKLLIDTLMRNERDMMPVLGGRLYPDVKDTIADLSRDYKLFMVSNCGEHGLDNFLTITGLKPYMTAWLSHGGTLQPKDVNIRALVERYSLDKAWYVGDTQGDSNAAHAAGVPMIWCRYGFGAVSDADFAIDNISEIKNLPL